MILADTSVWLDHFRSADAAMRKHLNEGSIVIHPFVVAELALGSLRERARTLALLDFFPQLPVAQISEVRAMIEARSLYGLGIGFVDANLIAAILLNPGVRLWTRDKRLRAAGQALGIQAGLR